MNGLTLSASDFEARCLAIIDQVANTGTIVLITKDGKPIAPIVPIPADQPPLKRRWEGQVKSNGDIVYFNAWEPSQ